LYSVISAEGLKSGRITMPIHVELENGWPISWGAARGWELVWKL